MRILFFIVLLGIGNVISAQTMLNWSDLTKGISWELPAPDAAFPGFQKATFSTEMRALEGTQIVITGYLLVLDSKQSIYLLSKNPMASCFFCGGDGPETIIDLKFTEKPSLEMDDLLSVKGILHLNEDNPNQCYYQIDKVDAIRF